MENNTLAKEHIKNTLKERQEKKQKLKEEQMKNEFLALAIKEQEEAVGSMLENFEEHMPKEKFDKFVENQKLKAKIDEEKSKDYICQAYSFDYDEEGYQVLVCTTFKNTTILDVVNMDINIPGLIYAQDLENKNKDSKVFYFSAFLKEIENCFKEKGFEDKCCKDIKELFRFLQKSKNLNELCHIFGKGFVENFYDLFENDHEKQTVFYPQLELVFDIPKHEVFASIVFDDEFVLVENVLFENIDKECLSLNKTNLPKTVKPKLPKLEFEGEDNVF